MTEIEKVTEIEKAVGFELTDDNYYSRQADIYYMSCSQFQDFEKCEAAAIAKMRGLWTPEKESDALFQGRYFHSAFESDEAFNKFCDENLERIFKTKLDKKSGELVITGKYAPFITIDECIETVKRDPLMKEILSWPGENEKPMIGYIGGVAWRMKMDKYCSSRRTIIDYKTSQNIWELYYNTATRQRQSFIEEYSYMMRAAVYGEIERQNAKAKNFPMFLILAVSKQSPPDKEVLFLNDDIRWKYELEEVAKKISRYQEIKRGSISPRRCGMCEYCRKTKMLKRIKMYTDLMPEFRYDTDNQEYDDYGGSSVFDTL